MSMPKKLNFELMNFFRAAYNLPPDATEDDVRATTKLFMEHKLLGLLEGDVDTSPEHMKSVRRQAAVGLGYANALTDEDIETELNKLMERARTELKKEMH